MAPAPRYAPRRSGGVQGTRRWSLASCLLLALALRFAATLVVSHPEIRRGKFGLSSDEPSFHNPAVALATTGRYTQRPGGPPTAFRPPGIILPLAALYRLVGPAPYVGVLYCLLCGVAVVVVAHRLAGAVSQDGRVAAVAALLAAVLPTLVFTSAGIWSEPQAILLTLALLWLLVREAPDRGGIRKWVVLGLCGSLAYLTRPSAVSLLPLLVVWAWLSGQRSTRLINTATLVTIMALPIGLWGLRNRLVFGEFLVSSTVTGEALYGSNNPVTAGEALPAKPFNGSFDLYQEAREGRYLGSWVPMTYIPGWAAEVPADASEIEIYRHQVASTAAFIREHPRSWAHLMAHKLVRLVTVEPYAPSITGDVGTRRIVHRAVTVVEYWFMLAWGAVGIWQLASCNRRAAYWFVGFAAAGVVQALVTYPNPRFLLPLTSVLIVPTALALTRVHDAWIGHRA